MHCVTIDGNIIEARNFEIIDDVLYSDSVVSKWWFNTKDEAKAFLSYSGKQECWWCHPKTDPRPIAIKFFCGELKCIIKRKYLFMTERSASLAKARYDFALKHLWSEVCLQ